VEKLIKTRRRPFFEVAQAYDPRTMGPISVRELLSAVGYKELGNRVQALADHAASLANGYVAQRTRWNEEIKEFSHTFDILASREIFLLERLTEALLKRAPVLREAAMNADRLSKERLNALLTEELAFSSDPTQTLIGSAPLTDITPDTWFETARHLVEYIDQKVRTLINSKQR
jgi:hypothetical protein